METNIAGKLSRTINEAVTATGLSRSTIYQMAKRGDIDVVKVAGRTLVIEASLQRVLASAPRIAA